MSVTDDLVAHAHTYARQADTAALQMPPRHHVAVVACMDARLNVYGLLGLAEGDAHVIRNAGGAVTEDVIWSLTISQRLLGTTEILLIHHTDCGMLTFADDEFRSGIQADTGIRPAWAAEAFTRPGRGCTPVHRPDPVEPVPAAQERAGLRVRRRHGSAARGDLGRHHPIDACAASVIRTRPGASSPCRRPSTSTARGHDAPTGGAAS